MIEAISLAFHPATPPHAIREVSARIIGFDENWLRLRWTLLGTGDLVVPAFAGKGRADGLWQTTCFEFFLQPADGAGYVELNLSPSERWNAYRFAARREGMEELPMPHEPTCTWRQGTDRAIFDAAVPASALPATPWQCAFTAVIEESGGHKSYWSVAHGGERPDFHDPACFTLQVAAPQRP